jgi:cell division protein FtsW
LVWLGCGLVAATLAATVDYRRTRGLAWVVLAITAVLLILARVPGVGRLVNGAWRWIQVGPMTLQPSELAKVGLVMAIAAYTHACQRRMGQFVPGLLIPGIWVSLILGLVLMGKDLGTTALLALLAGAMLFAAGTRLRHLIPTAAVGVVVLGSYLWSDPVRWRRVDAFLHPDKYPETLSVQSIQSTIAIGSGGTMGRGLGNGVQKAGYVPEQQTDFIFSAIGEELGLRVTLPLVGAYVAFVVAALSVARRAGDLYGAMIACGVGLVVGLQAVINIAVTTDSVPNKGLALPFVSYGGSCLVAMLTLVGLLINVALRAPREESRAFLPDAEDREASALQNA